MDMSGAIEPYEILSFPRHFTRSDVAKLATGQNLWEPQNLSSLVDRYDRASHAVDIDRDALSTTASEIRSSEILKATGEEGVAPEATGNRDLLSTGNRSLPSAGNLSLPFLLQLNITRFGTITLASIAIGILVPLYRFSERLAAFYRARADALRLHQTTGYKSRDIFRLSTMLTPTIDYGKSQTVPDNLMEMLRLVAHSEQDK